MDEAKRKQRSERQRQYMESLTPDQRLALRLKTRFGITLDYYYELKNRQNNKCAICHETPHPGKTLVVDHCHASKVVRGLLCHKCNTGIGMLGDSYKRIVSASKYIKSFNDKTFPPLNKL